ncbi:MAG TPA: RNA polymerase sigma factor [Pilimelia sp.]|nr:RNA polymerase sigma factor [Pilimelia sp.]
MNEQDLGGALVRARDGDQYAFADLWWSLQPSLLRYLRVVVGDAAHDVASETWLQAARDIRGFRGDADGFRVWLFRVARHRGLDELRRAGRRPADPLDSDDHPGTPDAAQEALDRLDTDWAIAVIATLPKDQAEAVMLRVVAGLDVAQTAAVLGKRSGAVRIATMRGLRRLAEHVEVKARRRADVRTGGWSVVPESPRPEGV